MSLTDDQAAEFEAKLESARQRCLYGKNYSSAYEVAGRIKEIRRILSAKEEKNADATLIWWERLLLKQAAGILLLGAITSSEKLREVANALDADENESAGPANILTAYEDCVEGRYPATIIERGESFVRCSVPTLSQLRDAFIKRFGEQCWPSEFGARKTLRTLGLPLSKAKKGRPPGSPSVIRNEKD